MKRILKTYWPFARGVMKEFVAYRVNFYVFIVGHLLQTSVLLYIWRAVYNSSSSDVINGFSFDDMIIYVVISTMTGLLVSNDVHWAVGSDVRTGDIAMNLIKPVNYQLRQYFSSVGGIVITFMYLFVPMWIGLTIYLLLSGGALPGVFQLLLYFTSTFLSSLLMFSINYLFGLAAFYVEYIFGFIFAKEAVMRLLSGELIPLVFYPAALLSVFEWLPFAGIVYTPVMIYLGKYQGDMIIKSVFIQVIWVGILLGTTQFVWNRAIKRLSILGG